MSPKPPKLARPRRILLASRNPGKVRELSSVLSALGVEAVGLDAADPLGRIAEPAETGATFADNARAKARYYARATGEWALADDSGLAVDELAGAPGVRSARFAAEDVPAGAPRSETDRANNRKLLAAMEAIPPERRTARFVCRLALADGERIVLEAEGVFEGRIGTAPRGDNGFGYDPIFFPAGLDRSAAELSATQKNALSHRGQAARRFARRLKELLEDAPADSPCPQ